ncbi:family 1 encapsulin nanocompartment shell protein [Cupriavidus basilensis]|uniref:family 1 encapsulin nanocompartment shell protein n=1 Tax=Cupriavidus basilensis TaxID=68895 RepID=UPI0009DA11DC|nr:family 1 encapsulin nanocompartment shell protein [Cupriavidus basilensis]
MNSLHRELAPVSSAAWLQMEEEVARTFKRSVAGQRVVDVIGPGGPELAGVGTGHLSDITAQQQGVFAKLRDVRALVQLTVPFELKRDAIDSVEFGARDSDWQPAKEAASQLAFAEDRAIFDGYAAAGIVGIREGSSNQTFALPDDINDYPDVLSDALEELRLAGVGIGTTSTDTDGPVALAPAARDCKARAASARAILKGSEISSAIASSAIKVWATKTQMIGVNSSVESTRPKGSITQYAYTVR